MSGAAAAVVEPETPPAIHAIPAPLSPFPSKLLPEDTVIIFDWDDTLLSSSWLAQNGLKLDEPAELPPVAIAQLEPLQDSVIALLTRAATFGRCIIITNAERGWVELSCKKFMPRVLPHLEALRLQVFSARSAYEGVFPDSPSDWKVQAFAATLDAAYGARLGAVGYCANIISFGDSVHERAAIHRVTSLLGPAARTKSIKFVERPTVDQLKHQVDLVCTCFEEIARHDGCLDLMLTIQLFFNGS